MTPVSPTEKTVYARLGGYDAIAAVVDEFLQTLSSDPQMARFSAGMNLERRKRNRQLTLDYLCAATGGPILYLGQDMKTAHAGLEISASEWKIAMDHVQLALAKFKVPDRESKELMACSPVSRTKSSNANAESPTRRCFSRAQQIFNQRVHSSLRMGNES